MSKIPFAAIQGGVASVDAPPLRPADVRPDPSAGGEAFAIAQGLKTTAEVTDKILTASNAVAVNDAVTESSIELDKVRGELDNDPDHQSRARRFSERAAEMRDRYASKLVDPRAREDFGMRFKRLSGSMQVQVQQEAREQAVQEFRQKLGDNLETLANRSVLARTEQERQAIQFEADEAIRDGIRTGNLKAIQGQVLKRAYLGKVDGALAAEMIRTNPGGAVAALGDPERFKYLDAAQRVQLRAQATNRSESLGAQARAELRQDVSLYTQARQAGQPVQAGVYEDLVKRSGGAGSALGRQIVGAKTFYDAVDVNTQSQSLPELRANVDKLESSGGGKSSDQALFDLSVARVVRRDLTQAERQARTRFNELDKEFETVRRQGEAYSGVRDLLRMADEIDPSGGLVATVRERDQLYDRLKDASGEGATRIRERITQIDQLRDEHGALDPARVFERSTLVSALDRKRGELDKDPAAAALKYYPTITEQLGDADKAAGSGDAEQQAAAGDMRRGAWAAMVEAQRREGVPEHRIALLPKPQADALKSQLLTIEGQGRVDLVEGLRATYGEQWPRVKAQLAQGQALPPDIEVLGALPAGANLPKVLIAEAFKVSDKQATEVLGNQRIGDIDKAVRAASAEMAATMAPAPGGPQLLATFQSAAERVARLYMIRGEGSAETAAQRATADVFYDHWETLGTLRIPKEGGAPVVPTSAVRDVQRQVIEALPNLELAVPSGPKGLTQSAAKEALIRNVRSFGTWLATADDKGMVLMAGPGLPVRFADGQPVIVPFDSVLAAAGDRAAADNLRRRLMLQDEGFGVDLGSDPAAPAAGVYGIFRGVGTREQVGGARRRAPASPTEGATP